MADTEQDKKSEFMIEKIKECPVNKKKLIRRTLITAAMAVIFGLIACFTFLVLEPVISNWLYPEEEPQIIVLPEDQEEMSPEEMLSDYMQQEGVEECDPENTALEEEQIREILAGITLSKDNYIQLYDALSQYVTELNKSMVTVTWVYSGMDWFNNVQESKGRSPGVIVANNGKELLLLTDLEPVEKAEALTLTFSNGIQVQTHIKQRDKATNLAVLSVNLAELPPEMIENEISIASLGSSNPKSLLGMPVVALGSPMGSIGSLGYGMVVSTSGQYYAVDANYRLLTTDIYGSQSASGVLFNLRGQVVGIISAEKGSGDMKNMITACGISDLRKLVEKLVNGSSMCYLGISGVDVTEEAHNELKVPYGAYVREIAMDSPAMLAGLQQGDVIVMLNDKAIMSFSDYTSALLQLEAGQTARLTVKRQAQEEYQEMSFEMTCGKAEE